MHDPLIVRGRRQRPWLFAETTVLTEQRFAEITAQLERRAPDRPHDAYLPPEVLPIVSFCLPAEVAPTRPSDPPAPRCVDCGGLSIVRIGNKHCPACWTPSLTSTEPATPGSKRSVDVTVRWVMDPKGHLHRLHSVSQEAACALGGSAHNNEASRLGACATGPSRGAYRLAVVRHILARQCATVLPIYAPRVQSGTLTVVEELAASLTESDVATPRCLARLVRQAVQFAVSPTDARLAQLRAYFQSASDTLAVGETQFTCAYPGPTACPVPCRGCTRGHVFLDHPSCPDNAQPAQRAYQCARCMAWSCARCGFPVGKIELDAAGAMPVVVSEDAPHTCRLAPPCPICRSAHLMRGAQGFAGCPGCGFLWAAVDDPAAPGPRVPVFGHSSSCLTQRHRVPARGLPPIRRDPIGNAGAWLRARNISRTDIGEQHRTRQLGDALYALAASVAESRDPQSIHPVLDMLDRFPDSAVTRAMRERTMLAENRLARARGRRSAAPDIEAEVAHMIAGSVSGAGLATSVATSAHRAWAVLTIRNLVLSLDTPTLDAMHMCM